MKSKKNRPTRPGGQRRIDLVLEVVESDSTFHLKDVSGTKMWVGNCLHCNRKLVVTLQGTTGATLEHIMPLSAGGSPDDLINLALACASCNNEKGIHHDPHVGKGGRADEVIKTLQEKRIARWREKR